MKDVLRVGELEHEANVDPLTGLFNRRYRAMHVSHEILRAQPTIWRSAPLCIRYGGEDIC